MIKTATPKYKITFDSTNVMFDYLDNLRKNNEHEVELYHMRRAIEKSSHNPDRTILQRYHDSLVMSGNIQAALNLRATDSWKKTFDLKDTEVDHSAIRLIAGQIGQMVDGIKGAILKSPSEFSQFIITLRRHNPAVYKNIADATRFAIKDIHFKNKNDEISIKLSIEYFDKYGIDIDRASLIYLLKKDENIVVKFFQNSFRKNVEIFLAFLKDFCNEYPHEFSKLGDRAVFRVLSLSYVLADKDMFSKLIYRLSTVYKDTSADRGPAFQISNIVRAFCARNGNRSVRKSDNIRIAVCISGQMRGYAKAFDTWEHLQLDKHQVKFFVHTWEDVGWLFPDPISGNGVGRVFKHGAFAEAYRKAGFLYGVERMKQSYPVFFAHLNVSSTVTESEIKAVYGPNTKVVVESHRRPEFENDHNNQIKMLYKVKEAHRLALEDGEEFDLVVRIRPDRAFRAVRAGERMVDWLSMARECDSQKVIYFNDLLITNTVHAGDQFAFGSPSSMTCYANTLDLQNQASRESWFGFPRRLRPHASLGNSLFFQGIMRRPLEGIYPIEAMPAALYGRNEIKQMLSLDLPNGPVTEMDRLLWNSLDIQRS